MNYKNFCENDWVNLEKNLPKYLFWRQFKFISREKIALKIKARNFLDLKKKLLQYEPYSAYLSVFYALNPVRVKAKIKNFRGPGYKLAQNIFIGADLVVEIDSNNENNFKKVLSILGRFFKKIKIYKTGRGFHIWIMDFNKWVTDTGSKTRKPCDREEYNALWRKSFSKMIIDAGCDIDEATTIDTRRVVRIPYSIYKNEKIIFEIKKEQSEEFLNLNNKKINKGAVKK